MKKIEILVSNRLKKILFEIRKDSIVAELLLKGHYNTDELVDDPINYISISSQDESKISYLNTERLNQISTEEERWNSTRRYHTRPGAFVGKVFKNISPREVEKFATLYRSQIRPTNYKFSIVEGEDIKYWYLYERYADQTGSLGCSCMKGEGSQAGLDFYIKNGVKMLIMLNDDNLLLGRALLWEFDNNKIMDRIYTTCDEDYLYFFKKWANKNGYIYKHEQRWNSTLDFESDGKKQRLKLEIPLKDNTCEKFPYLDTFKFIDLKKWILYNYKPHDEVRTCCSSDGDTQSHDYLTYDDIDHLYVYRGDTQQLSYIDIVTHYNNVHYSETNECYILSRDSEWSEELNDNIFKGEFAHLNNQEAMDQRREYIKKRRESKEEYDECKKECCVDFIEMDITISPTTDSTTYSDVCINSNTEIRLEPITDAQ